MKHRALKRRAPTALTALLSACPKAKIEEAEKVFHNSVVQYEVEMENGKIELDVVLDENGRIVSAKEEKEEEKDDTKDDRD